MKTAWSLLMLALVGGCDTGPSAPASDLSCTSNQCGNQTDLSVVPDLSAAEGDMAMATETVFANGLVDISGYGYTINAIHSSGFGASASFTTTTYLSGLTCADSTVGNCQVQNCNGNLLAATQTSDNVGPFTFTVGGSGVFTFNPDSTNFYAASPSPRPSPSPGATVTVNFPGLAAVSVVEPDLTTLVSPSPAPGNAVEISVENDFIAYFSGGSAGSVVTMKLTGQTATQSVLLTCTGDPTTGKVTAPKAALQIIPVTTNGTLGFDVSRQSTPVQFMGHATTVKASNVVLDSSGNQTGGFSATFTKP